MQKFQYNLTAYDVIKDFDNDNRVYVHSSHYTGTDVVHEHTIQKLCRGLYSLLVALYYENRPNQVRRVTHIDLAC